MLAVLEMVGKPIVVVNHVAFGFNLAWSLSQKSMDKEIKEQGWASLYVA